MRKIAVIGKFTTDGMVADGQTVKTNILTRELEGIFPAGEVTRISTAGWKKHPFRLFSQCVAAVLRHDNVLFLTDEGGIQVFPLLLHLANFRGRCRLHYYVVGGWLSSYLDRSSSGRKLLQALDAIYVEIPAMERELAERGFRNVVPVNKFRRMYPVPADALCLNPEAPYRLCYFSRVTREKGVEDAVAAVLLANERAGYEKFALDLYGFINEPYRERFEILQKEFPPCIRYRGIVDFEKSSSVLQEYFAMLFPSFFASEGYPNTIVDSFAAGLPVIATRWNYNADIIRDRVEGILVDVGAIDQMVDAMEALAGDPEGYGAMRLRCLRRCAEYQPEHAVRKVMEHLK